MGSKGVENMGTIRGPPKILEEFEKLSWTENRQLKESSPDVYWAFVWQIKNEDRKGN